MEGAEVVVYDAVTVRRYTALYCSERLSEWRVCRLAVAVVLLPVMLVQQGWAWGADGHRMINRLAVRSCRRMCRRFCGSARRWTRWSTTGRSRTGGGRRAEPELNAAQAPEHFIDLEWADLVGRRCRGDGTTLCGRWRMRRRGIRIWR